MARQESLSTFRTDATIKSQLHSTGQQQHNIFFNILNLHLLESADEGPMDMKG